MDISNMSNISYFSQMEVDESKSQLFNETFFESFYESSRVQQIKIPDNPDPENDGMDFSLTDLDKTVDIGLLNSKDLRSSKTRQSTFHEEISLEANLNFFDPVQAAEFNNGMVYLDPIEQILTFHDQSVPQAAPSFELPSFSCPSYSDISVSAPYPYQSDIIVQYQETMPNKIVYSPTFQKSSMLFCQACQMDFPDMHSISKHYKTRHHKKQTKREPGKSGENLNCLECRKTFSTVGYLDQHNQAVHAEKQFRCKKCGKKFNYEIDLRIHIIKHIDESKRGFQCEQCPKAYVYRNDLRRHELTKHHNDLPYKCSICNRIAFARKDHLKNHEKMHFKNSRKTKKIN